MSTPVPIKIALVCTIPLLHIPIAQAFGFELYTLPKIVVTSFTFFLLAYISWIVKAPLLAKLWVVMGLDERRAASSMWMADNVHLVSITATYILILSAQKPWHDGYGFIMFCAVVLAISASIWINILHDVSYDNVVKKQQSKVQAPPSAAEVVEENKAPAASATIGTA